MLLLSKLKTVAGGFLLIAAIAAAGWTCAARVSARAAMPGEDFVSRTEEEPRTPAGEIRARNSPTEAREAEFIFRGAEKDGKTVSLVIAGTSAPVLCLPVKGDLRVLVGGRQVGIDGLRPGTRVAIRLDPTNRLIQDVRALERPNQVTVLKGANDLARLESPSTEEVLRALPQGPRAVPTVLKVSRDEMMVVAEQLAGRVDPPRFYPLVGEAQLHHHQWKCTVHYTETVESNDPFPVLSKRPRVEVIYIDKDYLVPTR